MKYNFSYIKDNGLFVISARRKDLADCGRFIEVAFQRPNQPWKIPDNSQSGLCKGRDQFLEMITELFFSVEQIRNGKDKNIKPAIWSTLSEFSECFYRKKEQILKDEKEEQEEEARFLVFRELHLINNNPNVPAGAGTESLNTAKDLRKWLKQDSVKKGA